MPSGTKRRVCPAFRRTRFCGISAWLAGGVAVTAVLGLTLLFVMVGTVGDSLSSSRFGIQQNSGCVPSSGDAGDLNAEALGTLKLGTDAKEIIWDVKVTNLGPVLELAIEGPTNNATAVRLCGASTQLACTQPPHLKGTLNSLETGGSPRHIIDQIRSNAPLYALVIRTGDFPDCALRFPLTATF